LPTSTPAPDAIDEETDFSYDASLATGVRTETVPAAGATDGPGWDVAPEHVRFTFTGYVLPDTFHTPQIIVYPVSDFEAASENAANIIAHLRQFLAEKPAAAPDGIPFLPMFNAAQMMQARVEYLDFQNGTGVRFLTQYAQSAWPINNYELFYTFQGLTHDGGYYVAVILPVSSSILPVDGSDIPGGDYFAFADNFETYVIDMEQQLDAQAASSFTPDLSLLDGMIQSLQVK